MANQEKNSFLAALFSLFPGGGQLYLGNYLKGILYIVIFIMFILGLNEAQQESEEIFLGLGLAGFIIFQIFEAANDARRCCVENETERSQIQPQTRPNLFTAIFVLALGIIFQLNNLKIITLHRIYRFWPLILIIAGGKIIFSYLQRSEEKEETDEQK